MIPAVLLFIVFIGMLMVLILKKYGEMGKTELATYVALMAWGCLFIGFCMARYF